MALSSASANLWLVVLPMGEIRNGLGDRLLTTPEEFIIYY